MKALIRTPPPAHEADTEAGEAEGPLILGKNFHEHRAGKSKPRIAGHADVFGVRRGFPIGKDTTRDDGGATVRAARIFRHAGSLRRRTGFVCWILTDGLLVLGLRAFSPVWVRRLSARQPIQLRLNLADAHQLDVQLLDYFGHLFREFLDGPVTGSSWWTGLPAWSSGTGLLPTWAGTTFRGHCEGVDYVPHKNENQSGPRPVLSRAVREVGAGASAEPVTITQGNALVLFEATHVTLISDAFTLHLFAQGGTSDGYPYFQLSPGFRFQPGETVAFNAIVAGQMLGSASVVNGIAYPRFGDLLVTTDLRFSAALVTLTTSSGGGDVGSAPLVFDVTTPFTMIGSFDVARNNGTADRPVTGDHLLQADVVGAGTLEVAGAGTVSGIGVHTNGGVVFSFSAENPSPTPEPATLVLVGTAVAALLARRCRSANNHAGKSR